MSAKAFWLRTYQTPILPGFIVVLLIILSSLLTFVQGYDWITGDEPGVQSTLVMRMILGMKAWGLGLASGAAFLIIAMVLRNQLLVWVGHVFLCALYVCISIMILQAIFRFYGGDGLAEVVLPASAFGWHLLFVIVSRPFGTRRERE